MLILITYLALGALAGFLSGIFGIGGGLVIVPVLLTVFPLMEINPDILIHMAIGTSLATIIVTSISSVRAHKKRDNIDWTIVKRFVPWVVVGSFLGGAIANQLSGPLLESLFAVFLLSVAIKMGFGLKPGEGRDLPGTAGLATSGGLIGTLSSLFGIGGATISVPYLRWCSVPMARAVGISATLTFPIAVSGATSYLINGWQNPLAPEWSLGYIYLPAFFGIVIASTQCVRFGAALAVKLPGQILQRCFAAFLAFLGLRLLLG